MLLVIDVGNTNTVLGIYQDDRLLKHWRIRTVKDTTEDEYNILLVNLFKESAIKVAQIRRTLIACVVPSMVTILDAFCRKYLGHGPQWVDPKTAAGMRILTHNPNEVGADRIVNAVAAYAKYKTSLIVIDFGTATTFDVISEQGEYLGGAICPGVMIASEALFQRASKLPRVEIHEPPATVIGKDSISSIKSGIIYGYAGLVDGMVRQIKRELPTLPRVIATGGLARLIHEVAESIEAVEADLTLEGLKLIADTLSCEVNGRDRRP